MSFHSFWSSSRDGPCFAILNLRYRLKTGGKEDVEAYIGAG